MQVVYLGLPEASLNIECTTAKEFVRYLSDEKYRSQQVRWLFRGAKNASYPLLPASHRQEPPLPFSKVPRTVGEQIWEEFMAIFRFYEAAHYEGLPIPDWASVTTYLKNARPMLQGSRLGHAGAWWPSPLIQHLTAIAQHYGTPTRFLDWTRDALVAAYFAVPYPANNLSEPIAVWILDSEDLLSFPQSFSPLIIEIPYDLNQNARAQRGVFLNYLPSTHLSGLDTPLLSPEPFDKVLRSHGIDHALKKVTLPGSEAPTLLRELDSLKVNGATLFPGYLGASRAERERMWWDK